jgi:hypothetical protein
MKALVGILFLASTIPALAQQGGPDIATLQRATQVLQAQRNNALDQQAGAEVRAGALAEENAKLRTEIDELKKKAAADPAPK